MPDLEDMLPQEPAIGPPVPRGWGKLSKWPWVDHSPGNPGVLVTPGVEVDAEVDSMTEAKRREWEARGYSPHLVNMAIDLAREYAVKYSSWVTGVIEAPELRARAFKSLYKYGLDTVAEHWIREMAK